MIHDRFFLQRRARFAAPILLITALAGCGDKQDRHRAYGTVTIGKKPIRGGFVTIEPASEANGGGRQGLAPICDGRFDTATGGEPSVSGPVVIRIQGFGDPHPSYPNGVPVCHNYEMQMELVAGPNELNLEVPESARVPEPKGGWQTRTGP